MATSRFTLRPTLPLPDDAASGRISGTAVTRTPSGSAPPSSPAGTTVSAGTTTVVQAPEPKPVLPALREIVTAAIGVAIVFVTLLVAWQLFGMVDSSPRWSENTPQGVTPVPFDPFQRGKDVLLILLPLAGAIVGYYTGRVIADRTIDQANQTARNATESAAAAESAAGAARTESEQAKSEQARARAEKEEVKTTAEIMGQKALRALAARPVTRSAAADDANLSFGGGSPAPDGAAEVRELLERIRRL